MKKVFCIALIVLQLLSMFSGCTQQETKPTADPVDAYLKSAQEYVSAENYSAAIEVLEKGIKETDSLKLSEYLNQVKLLMENKDKQPDESKPIEGEDTSKPSVTPEFDYKDYMKVWASKKCNWNDGGVILDLYVEDGVILADLNVKAPASDYDITRILHTFTEEDFKSNTVSASISDAFDTVSCDVRVVFGSNAISISFSNLKGDISQPIFAYANQTVELVHNPDAWDDLFEKETEPTTGPSLDQIKNDLYMRDANIFKLDGVATRLNIGSIKLQYMNKYNYGEVYRYSIDFSNEYYKVEAVFDITYVPDGNAWYFSNWNMCEHQSFAIKSQVDVEYVKQKCKEHFSSFEITNQTYYVDEERVFSDVVYFRGVHEYKYLTEVIEGAYTYSYEDGYWKEDWDIISQTTDWSRIVGEWKFEHRGEYFIINIADIKQTSKNSIDITFSYKTSPWYDDGPWEGYFMGTTDGSSKVQPQITRTFEINKVSTDLGLKYSYGGVSYYKVGIYAFAMNLPVGGWEVEWKTMFEISFDIEKGFCIHDFRYLYKSPNASDNSWEWRSDAYLSTEYFKKVINWDDVQDAIGKLEGMNP